LELFAIDIVSIMRRDKHGSNKRSSQFSMDIGLEDGIYSFVDGTNQSICKGDCIVFLNALLDIDEKVAYKILTIEFNIRRKHVEIQVVF